MNAAVQNDFPLDLLGIFGTGERVEGLAAAGTLSLVFGQIVKNILRGEVLATFSPIAFGAWLLTSFACPPLVRSQLIRRVGVVIKSRSQIV